MATYSTPIPGAPGYEQSAALAQKAYTNAMARLQQQRSSSLTRYGYQRGADGTLSVDANNEYGGYQQMLRGEAGQSESLGRRQAASGWDSGSGYLGAQREDLQHAQGGEQAQFGQGVADTLAGYDQAEQGAAYDRDAALYQGELDAARNAVSTDNFNPADYSGIGADEGAVVPAPTTAARPKAAVRQVNAAAHAAARNRLVKKVAARRKGGR